MPLIIPRFNPGDRFYHELSPKARQHILELSKWIRQGKLYEMPLKTSSDHPWLACLIVTDGLPQFIICETWDDINRLQSLSDFEKRFSPEWYWVQNWAAILKGRMGRLPPPNTPKPG